MTERPPGPQLTAVTTLTQLQGFEFPDEPEVLLWLLLPDPLDTDVELLDEELHFFTGARTNVLRNIDRLGVPPLLLCP